MINLPNDINIGNKNFNVKFTLTEKGVQFADGLNQIRISNEPQRFTIGNKPSITIVATKDDNFYSEKLKNFLLHYGFSVTSNSGLDEENGFSSVSNSKSGLYSEENDYVIFIKSEAGDKNNSFGSILDIAIEAHENTVKRNFNYLYFAFIDDSKSKTRPRIDNYYNTFYDFRITTNRKLLILNILKDWERRYPSEKKSPLKYNFPTFKLQDHEVVWLKVIYQKFLNNEKFEYRHLLSKMWDQLPKEFEPTSINPLLVRSGSEITLLGIWSIDPESKIFENFDRVVYAIRDILKNDNEVKHIKSEQIITKLPDLTPIEVLQVFKLIWTFGGFTRGFGTGDDLSSSLDVDEDNIYREYRNYSGIETFVNDFYKKKYQEEPKGNIKNNEKLIDSADLLDRTKKAFENKSEFLLRDKKEIDSVLGIKEISKEIVEIIIKMPAEKGMMLGIFGKWGRGKTILLEEIWKNLENLKIEKNNLFERVDYHAWKYQETPASWAYLYESLAEKYYNKPNGFSKGYIAYWIRILKLNFEREGLRPILSYIFSLALSASAILGLIKWDHVFALIGIPVVGAVLITVLSKLRSEYSTDANKLIKKYGLKHGYKDTMGLQAEIQKEIIHLVKVWIPIKKGKEKSNHKKIMLFVEDIDRCAEDKIIQNIDALRIMLEDDEVSDRLIVLAAIDELVLKRAIYSKYSDLISYEEDIHNEFEGEIPSSKYQELAKLTNEYLDKLFIAGIKLGSLTPEQRDEFFIELTKNDRETIKVGDINSKQNKNPSPNNNEEEKNSPGSTGKDEESSGKEEIQVNRAPSYLDADPTKVLNKKEFEKLTGEEVEILRDCIYTWDESTPRKVRIFYYRYLLGKNLLVKRYRELGKDNIWQHPKFASIFSQLIIKYTDCYNPSLITSHKLKAFDNPESVQRIDMFGDVTINKLDYIEGLKF